MFASKMSLYDLRSDGCWWKKGCRSHRSSTRHWLASFATLLLTPHASPHGEPPPPTQPCHARTIDRRHSRLCNDLESLHVENGEPKDQVRSLSHAGPKAAKPRKIKDPEAFTGEKAKLFNFFTQCEIKFAGESDRFTAERQKVIYATG